MKNLLIVGLLIALVCVLIQRDANMERFIGAITRKRDTLKETPAKPPIRCFRSDIVSIVGRIASTEGGGLTIECPPPLLPPNPNVSAWSFGNANVGRMATKNLATLAAKEEAKYNAAVATAAKKVSGTVLVWGHPQESQMRVGMQVNVEAAPLGERSFTMSYEVAPDLPATWMKNSGAALAQPQR